MSNPAHAANEAAARNSYGRLIAFLAARSGDVAGAENAARRRQGIGAMGSGWRSTKTGSLAAARRAQPHYDAARCKQGRQDSKRFLQQIAEEAQTVAATHEHLPDERETLFVCP